MKNKDYYNILGVYKTATEYEIKTNYRKLAHELHPDKNPNNPAAEEKFKEATEAYNILSNPTTRSHYDNFGSIENLEEDFIGGPFTGSLNELFKDLFNNGYSKKHRQQNTQGHIGLEINYDLKLTLEQAIFGHECIIQYYRDSLCLSCKGLNSKETNTIIRCTPCNGVGKINISQGFFSIERTCSTCNGAGKLTINACNKCDGLGIVHGLHTFTVKTPPGTSDGMSIKYRGEGGKGKYNGPNGDLNVRISIKEHTVFKKKNNNIYCDIDISITQASLGCMFKTATLHKNEMALLIVPPGIQTGDKITQEGWGVRGVSKEGITILGDQVVTIHVKVPIKLSGYQKKLLKELAETLDE